MLTCVAHSQETGAPPLSAWIKIPSNESAFRVVIHEGLRDGNATMSLPGQRQKRLVDIDTIEKINFIYPPTILEALESVEQQEYSRAGPILKAVCEATIPFLTVPDNNVARILNSYQLSLHQLNQTALLRILYSRLALVDEASYSRTAKAWLAYLDTREGRVEPAKDFFSNITVQSDSGEVYFLKQMAYCRSQMAGKQFGNAIDHSARVIALGTIEDILYPEALLISAQCYDGLAEEEQVRLENLREEKIQKGFIKERVRIALELEAEADEKGTPPPSEQEILNAIDRQAVKDRFPPVPPIKENPFALIAQRLYLFTEQVFPATHWGKIAGSQVWEETRKNTERDLTNYAAPDIPN